MDIVVNMTDKKRREGWDGTKLISQRAPSSSTHDPICNLVRGLMGNTNQPSRAMGAIVAIMSPQNNAFLSPEEKMLEHGIILITATLFEIRTPGRLSEAGSVLILSRILGWGRQMRTKWSTDETDEIEITARIRDLTPFSYSPTSR